MIKDSAQMIRLVTSFLAEGIIAFLLFSSIFYYYYDWMPYWSYFFVLIGATLVFSVLSRFTNQFFWYLAFAPLLFGIYLLVGFLLFPSVSFTVVLTWRYVLIRSDSYLENEMQYVQWTGLLAIILVFLYNSWQIVIYLILQMFILMIGHILSNTVTIESQRKVFIKNLGWIIGGICLTGSSALVMLKVFGIHLIQLFWDTVIVKLWGVAATVIAFIASIPIYLLSLLNIEIPENEPLNQEITPGVDTSTQMGITEEKTSLDTYIDIAYIVISLVILAVILFIVYKLMKRRLATEVSDDVKTQSSYTSEKAAKKSTTLFKRWKSLFARQPSHPVRKLVYQFERRTEKAGYGRASSETLQEWLKRIHLNLNISTYEKVRYGEHDVNSQEVQQLKEQLDNWKPYT